MKRRLVWSALALASSGACAWQGGAAPNFARDVSSAEMQYSRVAANDAITRTVDGVRMTSRVPLIGPGATAASAEVAVGMTAKGAAVMAGRVLARGLPYVAAGVLIYDLYQAYRCHAKGDGANLACDGGQPKTPQDCWDVERQQGNPLAKGACYSSAGAASGDLADFVYAGYPKNCAPGWVCHYSQGAMVPNGENSYWVTIHYTTSGPANGSCPECAQSVDFQAPGFVVFRAQTMICPAYTDPYSGRSFPAGTPPGPDGKCGSGNYDDKTPDQGGDVFFPGGSPPEIEWDKVVKDAAQQNGSGGVEVPWEYTEPPVVTDPQPGEIPGPSTTTQSPGQTQTQTWKNKPGSPTVLVDPGTHAPTVYVPWKTETTTTTQPTDPNGNPVGEPTTTTTTTVPATPGQPGGGTTSGEEEQVDPCEVHPDRIGCSKYGTPEEGDLQQVDAPSVGPQGGWGAASAECPVPPRFTAFGREYTLTNAPLCNFLSTVRPIVIALAALASAMIAAGIGRST